MYLARFAAAESGNKVHHKKRTIYVETVEKAAI
jgi:hypothetical protein